LISLIEYIILELNLLFYEEKVKIMWKKNFTIIFLTMILTIFIAQNTCFAASKMELEIHKSELTIMQGGSNSTNIRVHNLHNETLIFVTLKFGKPSNLLITTSPIEYTDLHAGSTVNFFVTFSANQTLKNGTYLVKVSSITGDNIESNKYNVTVNVLYNPNLANLTTSTTSTAITTTSISGNVTSTEPVQNKTTTSALIEITKKQGFKKEYLIFLLVIVVGLFILPYLTFKK
jgi:hypothetical protein